MRPSPRPWHSHDDVRAAARVVARAHSEFVSGGSPVAVRDEVLASWRRSRSSGVDPNHNLPPVDLVDLDAYREAHPLAGSLPVIRRLLVDDAADAGLIVAVGDAAGRLLWVEGDASLRTRAAGMHFVEGARWDEAHAGTNAPGTALALDREVQIFAAEHFASNVAPWSCAAAPIHDPGTGDIIGVLDVTGGDALVVPQTPALVRAAVAAVESDLLLRSVRRQPAARGPLRRHPVSVAVSSPTPRWPASEDVPIARLDVLGVRRAVLRSGAEADGAGTELRRELTPRRSELLLLLSEHGDGLSADAAGMLLHDHDLPSVTVRAELSRLRAQVPELGLASRPYRLAGPLATDVQEVRDLLGAGDVAGAVAHYAGPVLPWSSAPGVRAVRDELWTHLRTAVLGSGDADLLVALANSHSPAVPLADIELWQATLAALPAGSTRRPGVLARLDQLERELR